MSGIAGLITLDGRTVEPGLLDRMTKAGHFRGKDGFSVWQSGNAGMVRFKHATTPEAVNEIQPFMDDQTGLTICFDGRIDNRHELLDKLRGSTGLKDDAPDYAIVLALFEQHHEECLSYLVGDYSLAIWQPLKRKLFCARSPLGFRPFHWYCDEKTFAFATDAKVIIDGLAISHKLNEAAIGEFIAMHFTNPTETFWKDIYRLEPGGSLILEDGRIRLIPWRYNPFPDLSVWTDEELIHQFKLLLDQSIIACMRSFRPVASHLSGGLDSSTIVCRAAGLYRNGLVPSMIQPVSARFPGEKHDETEWSSSVEELLELKAIVVTSDPYNWESARRWCAETYHLPLRPNVLGTLVASCKRVRSENMNILLTGEGGDDWLSGSHAHWPDFLRKGQLLQLLKEGLNDGTKRSLLRKLRSTALESAMPWISKKKRRQLFQPQYDCSYSTPDWLTPEWTRQIGLEERWRSDEPVFHLKSFAQQQRFSRYSFARHYVNWENCLAFGASQGVEFRHPFHDLRLTTFFMGVPGHILRRNGEKKYLLREAMRGILPEKVRTRQSKANLSLPIIESSLAYFSEHPIKDLLAVRMGWVDSEKLQHIINTHRPWLEARGHSPRPTLSFGPVWSVLSVELWLRHAIGIK